MTLHALWAAFLLVTLFVQTPSTAQINNYYNAPPQYLPPGTTPYQATTTTTFPTTTTQTVIPGTGAAVPVTQTTYPGVATYPATTTYPGVATYPAATTYPGVATYPGTAIYPGVSTALPATTATSVTSTSLPTYGTTSAYTAGNAGTNIFYPRPYLPTGTYYPYSAFNPTGNVSTAFTSPTSTSLPTLVQTPTGYAGAPASFAPIVIPVPSYAQVAPPDNWSPGLGTINNGKWYVTDFFYNLPPNIGVNVQIIRPPNKYVPLSESLLERKITAIFQDGGVTPTANALPCEPPLPVYSVTVMAYPCERRCVGVITVQLYEVVQPQRIDEDLSGVWQAVTWERQQLVASSCDDFAQEVESTITNMTLAFVDRYNHDNPIPQRSCF